jgi:hypothetical protein
LTNRGATTPGLPPPATLRLQGLYPRDALFPPKPPAMFQTVTLLGFSLRRFPLPRHGLSLSAYPARLALARTDPPTRAERILACLPGVALRGSPLSSASRRSGRTRASLGLRAPSRGTLPPRRPRSRRGPPPTGLVGFDASTAPEPASRSVDRGRPRDSPKRTSPPPGVSAPRPGEPGVGAEQVSTTLL